LGIFVIGHCASYLQVQNVQHAGFIAAVIHSVDSDRLLQMHGTASKQQFIVLLIKHKGCFCNCFIIDCFSACAFSASTLLGGRKGIWPVKNLVVGC